MLRSKSIGDFDVVTGPPALPASLQKPAGPAAPDAKPTPPAPTTADPGQPQRQ